MGMLGNVMNALALQDFIDQSAFPPACRPAITMAQVAEPYFRCAIRHLEKAASWSSCDCRRRPFSTDTVSGAACAGNPLRRAPGCQERRGRRLRRRSDEAARRDCFRRFARVIGIAAFGLGIVLWVAAYP